MSLASLERSLVTTGLAPAYVIVGDARPLVDRAVTAIMTAAKPELGPVQFNLTTTRAGEPDAAGAFRTARTLPMMGRRRVVLVREIENGDEAFFAAARDYLEKPVQEATVILSGERFPKVEKGGTNWSVAWKKALGERGLWESLSAKDVRPADFAREQARGLGKQLSGDDARVLVEVLGEDLSRLAQEVEKLTIFVGDRPEIRSEDIHAATAALAEAVIWDLTAAIASGDAELALESLHRLQAGGDDPRRLLSMIAWQARDLCKVAARVRAGVADADIRAQVKMRPEIFQRARRRMANGFPHEAVMMGRLADANRQMNSHRAGAERILEELVLGLLEA